MTKVKFEGEDILTKPPSTILDKELFQKSLTQCLPQIGDGMFSASMERDTFQEVSVSKLAKYPYAQIDYFSDEEIHSVATSGGHISMLAFQGRIDSVDSVEISLKYPPSFITIYKNVIQYVFILHSPMFEKLSGYSIRYLDSIISKLETDLDASNIYEILNPCASMVTSWISSHIHKYRFYLKDLHYIAHDGEFATLETLEDIIRKKEEMNIFRAKGGRTAAAARKAKSVIAINNAISEMKAKCEHITQGAVASYSGLSRKTVNKNWSACTV